MSLQIRWEALQNNPEYTDKAKYKLMEDMIAAHEIAIYGAAHPAYGKQLDDLDKCWSTVRNFMVRLIEDAEKAEDNAKKRVENTLKTMESEVKKIPMLEKERDEYWHKYYDVRKRCEELEKLLEEEKARTADAAARCKEAEAKANELQAKLNEANTAIVKQVQEFMTKYVRDDKKTETANSVATDEKSEPITETVTTDNVPSVPPETAVVENGSSTVPPAATSDNSTSAPEAAEPDTVTTEEGEKRRGRKKSKA